MSESDETLKQNDPILQAIAELSKKIDAVQADVSSFQKDTNAQLESIREGIVHNGVAFDRLQAVVFNLRADVREMSEEIRHLKAPV